jgi:hypothetical protein
VAAGYSAYRLLSGSMDTALRKSVDTQRQVPRFFRSDFAKILQCDSTSVKLCREVRGPAVRPRKSKSCGKGCPKTLRERGGMKVNSSNVQDPLTLFAQTKSKEPGQALELLFQEVGS